MRISSTRIRLSLSIWILVVVGAVASPKAEYGEIELVRDTWGIPHIFSKTDAGAMYGLGYATAEERGIT